MADDIRLQEEVAQEVGLPPEQLRAIRVDRNWDTYQGDTFLQGSALLMGRAKNKNEFLVEQFDKILEERRAKKAEEQDKIEGCLRVLHPDKAEEFYLRVTVDTGATVNAITYGMLIDYQLENRKVQLKEPKVLLLAVGNFECSEQISLSWMGRGNQESCTAIFYVLPRGQANITDIILSKEWLSKRGILYDRDPSPSLKPLIGSRQSASEEAARKQEHQRAKDEQASSSKAKDAYQKNGGQKQQGSSSAAPSHPKDGCIG